MQGAAEVLDIPQLVFQRGPEGFIQIIFRQCPQLRQSLKRACGFDVVGQKDDHVKARHVGVARGMKTDGLQHDLVGDAEIMLGDMGRKQGVPDFRMKAIFMRQGNTAPFGLGLDLLDLGQAAAVVKQAGRRSPNHVFTVSVGKGDGVVHGAERMEETLVPDGFAQDGDEPFILEKRVAIQMPFRLLGVIEFQPPRSYRGRRRHFKRNRFVVLELTEGSTVARVAEVRDSGGSGDGHD